MSDENPVLHERKLNIFLSYSRKDAAFVDMLASALEGRGYHPVFDQSDRATHDPDLRLTAQDEWWAALKTMIAACDVMVFVVTPESAASAVCDDEIAFARAIGKRIIAIQRRQIDFNLAPERLRALQMGIDCSDDQQASMHEWLDALCAELDLDIEWHRRASRLSRQAHAWYAEGRPEAALLRSGAIESANAWLARRPSSAPPTGAVLREFLTESSALVEQETTLLRSITGRAFVRSALQAHSEGAFDKTLRAIAAGVVLSRDFSMTLVSELAEKTELLSAVFHSQLRSVTRPVMRDATERLRLTPHPDARLMLVVDGRRVQTVAVPGGTSLSDLTEHQVPVREAVFALGGAQFVIRLDDGSVQVLDTVEGSLLFTLAIAGAKAMGMSLDHVTGKLCTWWSDNHIRLSSLANGALLSTYHVPRGLSASSIVDSRLSKCLTDGPGDGFSGANEVLLWELKSESVVIRSIPTTQSIVEGKVFSPDGEKFLLVPRYGRISVHASRDGALLCELEPEIQRDGSACFNPDGSRVVVQGQFNAPHVCDASSGASLFRLEGHELPGYAAAFSNDGACIATGAHDGLAILWDAREICPKVGDAPRQAAFGTCLIPSLNTTP
jgi:hypothetical protein